MLKVKIITIGKLKEKWLKEALTEYEKRLTPVLAIDWVLTKDEKGLKQLLEKEKEYICLDCHGITMDSIDFSKNIFSLFEKGGSKLTFVIGGDTGISQNIKEKALLLLSLSKLTFTHQIVRLIFIEQLYRAFEISKGSEYHK